MGQHLDFYPAIGFVLPCVERVGEEKGLGAMSFGLKPVFLDALVHQPSDQRFRPAQAGPAIEPLGPGSVRAVHVPDDAKRHGWIVLHPFDKFLGDREAFGVDAVLIALKVNAKDVGAKSIFKGPEGNVDAGFPEQVRPE